MIQFDCDVFEEPELEFGAHGRHVDIRFGIQNHGPLDYESDRAPRVVKLAIVGTPETVEGTASWLDRCRREIAAKTTRLINLFPSFPGFRADAGFRASLSLDSTLQRSLPSSVFRQLATAGDSNRFVTEAVRLVVEEFRHLSDTANPDVLVCAVPPELVLLMDPDTRPPRPVGAPLLNFHDMLKAEAMSLRKPVQLVLPGTYDPKLARKQKIRDRTRPLQDDATRAWNFHTALYYKAGGRPWRIMRDATALTSCYVGVSFYFSLDKSSVMTSMAQVFDERGEGVVVRGGPVQLSKDDRTPHLSSLDATTLLLDALRRYREVHYTLPARIVVHKTSAFDAAELAGFEDAARQERITVLDCVSMTRDTEIRAFREGNYPPLRGSFLSFDSCHHLLYTRGSVDFFSTYPGLYVPRPLFMRLDRVAYTPKQLGRETLALSKMNWNDAQFDGSEPITVVAARRVGRILKYVAPDGYFAPHYGYYM